MILKTFLKFSIINYFFRVTVEIDAEPMYGLKLGPLYEKMEKYYFGESVRF